MKSARSYSLSDDILDYVIEYESSEMEGTANTEAFVLNMLHVFAAQGNEEALYLLGFRYQEGKSVVCSLSSALFLFKKASAKGHRLSAWYAAKISEKMLNMDDYIYYLQVAGSLGCLLSLDTLARESDEQKAFQYDLMAASMGPSDGFFEVDGSSNIDAIFRLAKCFLEGRSFLDRSESKAAELFNRVAYAINDPDIVEQKSNIALYHLGLLAERNISMAIQSAPRENTESLMPNHLQAAIFFMRKSGTQQSTEWLKNRGISELYGQCAGCHRRGVVPCFLCRETFFCGRRCVEEIGLHFHLPFCTNHLK